MKRSTSLSKFKTLRGYATSKPEESSSNSKYFWGCFARRFHLNSYSELPAITQTGHDIEKRRSIGALGVGCQRRNGCNCGATLLRASKSVQRYVLLGCQPLFERNL